jgi:hypothetical protein
MRYNNTAAATPIAYQSNTLAPTLAPLPGALEQAEQIILRVHAEIDALLDRLHGILDSGDISAKVSSPGLPPTPGPQILARTLDINQSLQLIEERLMELRGRLVI